MTGILQSIFNFFSAFFQLSYDFFCWCQSVLNNPVGFANATLNGLTDIILYAWPATPPELKLSTITNSMLSDAGWLAFFMGQIITGVIVPLLGVYLVTVVWKYLPFT